MSYKQDIQIDKNMLDEEWIKQPLLYMDYSQELAQKIKERDQAKDKINVLKAEIDDEIREIAKNTGNKITEAYISNQIQLRKEYKDACQNWIDKNEEVNILDSVKEALNHKKKALENLTQLFFANYYSSSSITDDEVHRKNLTLKNKQ